ncbi:MAG: Nudix family hydrolase [Cycloclasticus sp.]
MLKVAVAVIKNKAGQILISKRADHVHQAGLWEFPGGKLEAGESTHQALSRELAEELGITVLAAKPLLQIKHQYEDLAVFLDVYTVDDFAGKARGMEGQPVKWVDKSELVNFPFPAANQRIVETLLLPAYYPIVDECLGTEVDMFVQLERLLAAGHQMIQLRAKSLSAEQFKVLAKAALSLCQTKGVTLFLNTSLQCARELNASAVHLSTHEFVNSQMERLEGLQVGVSCHTEDELYRAAQQGALFAVLSPVCNSKTHPEAEPLGWDVFAERVLNTPLPVYALGGLQREDLETALATGAQGIAAIRGFV